MFGVLLFLLAILGIATVFGLKIEVEEAIAASICTIIVILLLFGLLGCLYQGVFFVLGIAICGIFYSLFNKKFNMLDIIKAYITPGSVIFIIIFVFLCLYCRGTRFSNWDEFSHWGINTRSMIELNVLWTDPKINGFHLVYPPGIGLFQYFLCKLSTYNESRMYLAYDVFCLAFLIIPLKGLKFKSFYKALIYIPFLFVFIILCGFSFTSIYADLALAVVFGTLLYQIFGTSKCYNNWFLITQSLFLFILVTIKDSGLVLSFVVLGIIFLNIVFNLFKIVKLEGFKALLSIKKLTFFFGALMFFSPFISYFIWQFNLKLRHLSLNFVNDGNIIAPFNFKSFINALLLNDNSSVRQRIADSFYNGINSISVTNSVMPITAVAFFITLFLIGWIGTFFVSEKYKQELSIFNFIMGFGCIGYFFFILIIFMFLFTPYEGLSLASYSRYVSTYFFAWGLALFGFFLKNWNESEPESTEHLNSKISVVIIICLCFSVMNFSSLMHTFKPTIKNDLADSLAVSSQQVVAKTPKNSKVYIIYQNSNGFEFHIIRYSISPRRTNLFKEWSLGWPYNINDQWTTYYSPDEWITKLKLESFDYVFLANIDDTFIKLYGSCFYKKDGKSLGNNISSKSLYKVEIINGKIRLILVT